MDEERGIMLWMRNGEIMLWIRNRESGCGIWSGEVGRKGVGVGRGRRGWKEVRKREYSERKEDKKPEIVRQDGCRRFYLNKIVYFGAY